MEYYAAIKKDEFMSFAGTWMKVETIILGKLTQEQETKQQVVTHKQELNNKNTWTQREEHHTVKDDGWSELELGYVQTESPPIHQLQFRCSYLGTGSNANAADVTGDGAQAVMLTRSSPPAVLPSSYQNMNQNQSTAQASHSGHPMQSQLLWGLQASGSPDKNTGKGQATREAEAEESLDPRRRGCSEPRLYHCTPAWQQSKTLSLKKKNAPH
ncbi:retrotransposable element ORF2 protein [Plecturocebus cupreus]